MKICSALFFIFGLLFIPFESGVAQQENSPGYAAGKAAVPKQGPNSVYVVGNGVKPPIVLQQPLPPYTLEARDARIEGIVVLQAIVRKDGTVDSFRVLRRLGYGLDESAINTIRTRWRFSPGTLNGQPVDVMANIQVAFRFANAAERESLEPYNLRVHIISSQLNGTPSPNFTLSGHGNIWNGSSDSGFTYQCFCPQSIVPRVYSGKWIEPDLSLELALGYDQSTRKQKTCELKLHMQQAPYTMRDVPIAPAEPPQR